ncbi:MAG TPA: hypothetical protein VGS08_05105 [Candidatus Saccharimonadales bacterium]|nr:hypothetical protein [Candidatus Saccharimonadales bacterium]
MGPAINQLIREILEADGMLDRQLVWRVCPSCFMRVALSLVNGRILKARWFCTACKLSQTEELEWGLTAYEDKPAFVPRVLLCDMIDLRILQTGVSVSYGSSEGHLLRAKTMYERMHLSQPATHDFLWAPQNMHFVPSQFLNHNLWERGRFSTPLYLSLFGQQKICKEVFDIPLNPMP